MLSSLLSLDAQVVIAHRGGAKLRPENTLVAFEHAVSLGVDAIECDVHVSKDGQVVVIHDETLERTTDAHGPVAALTADELARVDAGAAFIDSDGRRPFRGQGIGVPRLVDVLRRFPATPVVIEIKGDRPEVVAPVLDAIRAANGESRVIVGGFSQPVLTAVRVAAPAIVTSASVPEVKSALTRSWCRLPLRQTGCRLFQIPIRLRGRRVLSRRLVRASRRAGFPVQVWVVDDEVEMRMVMECGVTGIITDRPDVAVGFVRRADSLVPEAI